MRLSDDLTIHYEAAGNGEIAIVFVPGWTMTSHVFEHQLSHLAGSDRFRTIAYDPRGQGLSSKTAEGHYYEQHGRDLHLLVETLGLERFVLVGWSNGGFDALAYLNQFGGDKLAGLVLIDATPAGRGTDYTEEWVPFGTIERGDQDGSFEFFTHDVVVDRLPFNRALAEWMLENHTTEAVRFVLEQTNQTSDTVAVALMLSSWWLDYSPDLVALNGSVPLLYVVREEWGALAGAWALENTPEATVVAFGEHMMFWERHQEFNQVLDQFLDTVR